MNKINRKYLSPEENAIIEKFFVSGLSEDDRSGCNRLHGVKCSTLACLLRGGYKQGSVPVDFSVATCPIYELYNKIFEK